MLSAVIRPVVFSLLIFSVSLATSAQSRAGKDNIAVLPEKGSVSGTVTAPGLANASGVRITLRGNKSSATAASQMTGWDGGFVFFDIAPGVYSVEIDPSTVPQKYRSSITDTIEVKAGSRIETAIILEPKRSIVGHAYIDVDRNGLYSPGRDLPVTGAQVSVGASFAVSKPDGSFRIDELPAGRISLIVRAPGEGHVTHVVLDLSDGPVTDRVVNVPIYR